MVFSCGKAIATENNQSIIVPLSLIIFVVYISLHTSFLIFCHTSRITMFPFSPFSCSPVYPPACSPFFLFAKSFAIFIIVCGDYLKIHTVNGPVKTLVSFSKLRTMLPAEEFIRIHRSFIIPLRKIRSMEKRWILIGQKRVPLGDYYKKEYLKPLNQ